MCRIERGFFNAKRHFRQLRGLSAPEGGVSGVSGFLTWGKSVLVDLLSGDGVSGESAVG